MLFRKKSFNITNFWVKNANINFFEEKCVYNAAFKVQTISYCSSRLTKHQTIEIWLLLDFVRTS